MRQGLLLGCVWLVGWLFGGWPVQQATPIHTTPSCLPLYEGYVQDTYEGPPSRRRSCSCQRKTKTLATGVSDAFSGQDHEREDAEESKRTITAHICAVIVRFDSFGDFAVKPMTPIASVSVSV